MLTHMKQWGSSLLFPASHVWLTPFFFATAAAISLASAYIAQYGYDLQPCVLCLYQRVPFAVIVVVGAVGALRSKHLRSVWIALSIITLSYFAGTAIATFHTGVEYGWWEGTDSCGSNLHADNIDTLRAMIMSAPVAKCTEAPFYFLGLSMAGWNVVWSGGLAILSAMATYGIRRRIKYA